jgi:hypothetical protein
VVIAHDRSVCECGPVRLASIHIAGEAADHCSLGVETREDQQVVGLVDLPVEDLGAPGDLV